MSNDRVDAVDLTAPPTSVSPFKRLGHLVIGFPDNETCGRAARALKEEGFTQVRQIRSDDMRSNMAQMLDMATGLAEFDQQVVEMRKYLALSTEGYGWLFVPASDDGVAHRIVSTVGSIGARVAAISACYS